MNNKVKDYSPDKIENNESSICAECGGNCCKRYAGSYHPDDFKHEITEEFLESLINPVMELPPISIDWYENFVYEGYKGFFIRPRHVGGDIVDPSYGAKCILLTPVGCKLDWEHRPWVCKQLEPNPSHKCGDVNFDPKYEAAKAWDPYHDILEKLYQKYDKGTYTGNRPTFNDLIEFLGLSFGLSD